MQAIFQFIVCCSVCIVSWLPAYYINMVNQHISININIFNCHIVTVELSTYFLKLIKSINSILPKWPARPSSPIQLDDHATVQTSAYKNYWLSFQLLTGNRKFNFFLQIEQTWFTFQTCRWAKFCIFSFERKKVMDKNKIKKQ